MKKILSLTLAVMLLLSAIPTAYAADQDYSLGTAVTVEGAGGECSVCKERRRRNRKRKPADRIFQIAEHSFQSFGR